jgi:hypothetical protein
MCGAWTFSGQGRANLTIVGQSNGLIAGGASPTFVISSGLVYARDVTLSSSAGTGITATGGELHLDTVVIDGCRGGGVLLDGAAFDIRNTTVSQNGPADDMGSSWGGVRIKNPPTSGPAQLSLTTVQMNDGGGISCSAAIQGSGVLSVSNTNTPVQVSPTCGFTSCASASATCGAQ